MAERIAIREAVQLPQITQRQVFRLLKAYQAGCPAALVSSRRGKPSNRSYPATLRSEVLALITATYADFDPTLNCEKLAERHGIALGVETIRRWMIPASLWQDRKQRLECVHQPRDRRGVIAESSRNPTLSRFEER